MECLPLVQVAQSPIPGCVSREQSREGRITSLDLASFDAEQDMVSVTLNLYNIWLQVQLKVWPEEGENAGHPVHLFV